MGSFTCVATNASLVTQPYVQYSIELSGATWHGVQLDYLLFFILVLVIFRR